MKNNSFIKLLLFGFICTIMAASCTKEGPMGPAGADGADGINGVNGANGIDGEDGSDGKDGVDGNDMCLVCHTQAGMDDITAQYASSAHGMPGFEFGYAGSRAGCMECHSNEGHIYATVGYYPESNLDFSSRISCETCHGDHVSLEAPVPAPMRSDAAVTSKADGTTVFDFESNSNTCAYCHQSRTNGDAYSEKYEVGDSIFTGSGTFVGIQHADSVYLSSTHAGPHHAPNTNTIYGIGGYTTEPGLVMSAHKRMGCVKCHMGEPEDGVANGGHTWLPTLNTCLYCHTSATDFDINGTQTKITEAEQQVAEALVEAGILDEEHEAVVGMYHIDVFEAYWNYLIIKEDGSEGVHNPDYCSDLLNYAKDKLGL